MPNCSIQLNTGRFIGWNLSIHLISKLLVQYGAISMPSVLYSTFRIELYWSGTEMVPILGMANLDLKRIIWLIKNIILDAISLRE